jgi:thioester reductase-like protein
VLENCALIFDRPPVGVSWLPQYHDMGLIGSCLFVSIAGGTTHLFSPIDFLQRPVSWLEAMSRFQATASAAPNFAYEFCLRPDRLPDEDLDGVDLRSLSLLMNGAEPVRAETFRRFQERFGPYGLRPGAFCAAYGLAEHTLAVSNRGTSVHAFDAGRLAHNEAVPAVDVSGDSATIELVSCGPPLGDTEVRIVDVSQGAAEAPPGFVGEIWIDGPSKAPGYWNRPDLTKQTFEARLDSGDDQSPRWLRTGDLGFMHDGELFLCGRLKDMIIVRGLNYYPQDVEDVVAEDAAIRNGCVAAFAVERDGREGLAVVAELRSAALPDSTEGINARLRERLGIAADSFTYIPKRTIPKTSSGKIMRHAVQSRWLQEDLRVVAHVECRSPALPVHDERDGQPLITDNETAWGTAQSLDRTFQRRGLTGTERVAVADVGLDSLGLVELAVEVEKHLEAVGASGLGGVVDLRWLQRFCVADLVEILHQLIASTPGAKLRFARAFAAVREEQLQIERHMIEEDARLAVPGFPTVGSIERRRPSDRGALLTGGTGFFGPFLLRSLLEQTDDPIYVLIRARNEEHAYDRLNDSIESLGPELQNAALTQWRRRVIPVCGDLGKPDLGLSTSDWTRLARKTHVVYHSGAWVNYLHDYATLRQANVIATRDLLRLATDHGVKVVNYVSTTFVFGWSTQETLFERDSNQDLSLLDFGYSQSKWVSEQIVLRAMGNGLPARVFRPALIAPSVCGCGEYFDIAMRMLTFMLKHGLGTTAQNQVSLSPADLVADNIVAISGLPDTIGETFHVTRDTRSTMRDITTLLSASTGRQFAHYGIEDFVTEVVARCSRDDLLFPLLNFLVRSVDNIAAMEFKLYDNQNYRRARARSPFGKEDPPMGNVVAGIVRFMHRHGLLETPHSVNLTEGQ